MLSITRRKSAKQKRARQPVEYPQPFDHDIVEKFRPIIERLAEQCADDAAHRLILEAEMKRLKGEAKKHVADGLQDDELAREGERLVEEAERERNRSKDPA